MSRRIIFVCLACLSVFTTTNVNARTWIVHPDGTGDAPTIQAAIDTAAVGDTVFATAGQHTATAEQMVNGVLRHVVGYIDKDLVVHGETGTEIFLDQVMGFAVVAGAVTIADMTFNGTYPGFGCVLARDDFFGNQAVDVESATATLTNISVSDVACGVRLGSGNLSIVDGNIEDCENGIRAIGGALDLTSSRVANCGELLSASPSCAATIFDCRFEISSLVCEGVYVANGSISQCEFEGMPALSVAGHEASLTLARSAQAHNNRFVNARLAFAGISEGMAAYNNVIVGGQVGDGDNPLESRAFELRNNTLVEVRVQGTFSGNMHHNIFVRPVQFDWWPAYTDSVYCNLIFNPDSTSLGSMAPLIGVDGNVLADPQFCGVDGSGNYLLQNDSPAAAANNTCGLIGAFDVGCGPVSVRQRSLGSLKSLMRGVRPTENKKPDSVE